MFAIRTLHADGRHARGPRIYWTGKGWDENADNAKLYKTAGRARNQAARMGDGVVVELDVDADDGFIYDPDADPNGEQLATAVEKALKAPVEGLICLCGCGERANVVGRRQKRWVQGHDQRAFSIMNKALAGDQDHVARGMEIANRLVELDEIYGQDEDGRPEVSEKLLDPARTLCG